MLSGSGPRFSIPPVSGKEACPIGETGLLKHTIKNENHFQAFLSAFRRGDGEGGRRTGEEAEGKQEEADVLQEKGRRFEFRH